MSERKVLNKYYPPDFDPSKIPRMKLAKNRQYTVRLMAPFNMRCATCGEYIYKGKKFNARKEDVENEDYLGIRIYRFYIKCTRCLQEISFKTDPQNTDYVIEAGATRNFMALKLAEEQAKREEDEQKEEEANNPMKLLEIRTEQSRQEIELLESLEELKELNRRQRAVDYEGMLQQYQPESAEERRKREQSEDDQFIKSIKFGNSSTQKVVAEEIIEEVDEPPAKTSRIEFIAPKTNSVKKIETWNKSIGVLSSKAGLANLVKKKTDLVVKEKGETQTNKVVSTSTITSRNGSTDTSNSSSDTNSGSSNTKSGSPEPKSQASGLSLLANYSGSDSDSQPQSEKGCRIETRMELLCAERVSPTSEAGVPLAPALAVRAAAPDPVMLRRRVLDNLLRTEERYAVTANYFGTVQTEVTPHMRRVVAEWMLEVCEDQNCQEEVFPLAVSYLDRFLSTCHMRKSQVQLLGTACLLLASKMREPSIRGLPAELLVFYTANSITLSDLCCWEMLVLSKLKWDVAGVTAHDFLPLLLSRLPLRGLVDTDMVQRHAQTFIALAARDYEFTLHSASTLAACSIAAALRGLGLDGHLHRLHDLTNIDLDCLQTCLEQVEAMVQVMIEERAVAPPNGPPRQAYTTPPLSKTQSSATTPTDIRDVHF